MLPLGVVAVAFLCYSLPPYLALDPAGSRVPAPQGFAAHYFVLVGHVLFGSVAMLTCCLQIWPWFRRRYPLAHRRIGRVYVFAGVVPSALLAITVGSVSPFGPVTVVSDVLLGVVWLGCTTAGWRAVRQRRFADHRRWMIRSFALTMSIIVNRIVGPLAAAILAPRLATTFDGSEVALGQSIAGLSAWTSWVLVLLVAQWWLDRKPARKVSASVPAR
ncbi:DUF2306 domain-containing protein [Amycolatopsis sp. H20-H5]|nr:DUF2306 domain-containing protein [Amycolatopsis sp. H20-H5]MEC3975258.1 DUF2306 domain-containing protein [Amycolatopsis sp. H20-H5]